MPTEISVLKPAAAQQIVTDAQTARDQAQGHASDASQDAAQTALDVIATQAAVNNAQASARSVATWAVLETLTGAVEGEGAEVLDSDTGTHLAATATGYDGSSVNNAGRYSWNATWERWVRIGNTGLAGKLNASELQPAIAPFKTLQLEVEAEREQKRQSIEALSPADGDTPDGWWRTGDEILQGASRREVISDWHPSLMYQDDERGWFLDPSAEGALFRDPAARLPAHPGDFVRVAFDAARGGAPIGPQIVPDGDFDEGVSQFVGSGGAIITHHNGNSLRIEVGISGTTPRASLRIPTRPGQRYVLQFSASNDPSGGFLRAIRADGATQIAEAATTTAGSILTFVALDFQTVLEVRVNSSSLGNATIFDYVLCRPISGYRPGIAPSDVLRPRLGVRPVTGRRNALNNSALAGSAVGTLSGAGSLPSDWFISGIAASAIEVLSIDDEEDLPTIVLRLNGTPTGTVGIRIGDQVAVAPEQVWTRSAFVEMIDGDLTNINAIQSRFLPRTGTTSESENIVDITSDIEDGERKQSAFLIPSGTTDNAFFRVTLTNSGAIDITLKIQAPQLERGGLATPFQRVSADGFVVIEDGVDSVRYFSGGRLVVPAAGSFDDLTVFAAMQTSAGGSGPYALLQTEGSVTSGGEGSWRFQVSGSDVTPAAGLRVFSQGALRSQLEGAPSFEPMAVWSEWRSTLAQVSTRVNAEDIESNDSTTPGAVTRDVAIHVGAQSTDAGAFVGECFGAMIIDRVVTADERQKCLRFLGLARSRINALKSPRIIRPTFEDDWIGMVANLREERLAGRKEVAADKLIADMGLAPLDYGDDPSKDNSATLTALLDRASRGRELVMFEPGVLFTERLNLPPGMYWRGGSDIVPTRFMLRAQAVSGFDTTLARPTGNNGNVENIAFDQRKDLHSEGVGGECVNFNNAHGWLMWKVISDNAGDDAFDLDDSTENWFAFCDAMNANLDGFHNSAGTASNRFIVCTATKIRGTNRGAFTSAEGSLGGHVFYQPKAGQCARGFSIRESVNGPNVTMINGLSVGCNLENEVDGIAYGGPPASDINIAL